MSEQARLIAPCGMNCGICSGYLRLNKRCPGCHGEASQMPAYCTGCIIKNCETIRKSRSGFCFECKTYPCKRLKALDKRYRTKYKMSMLENLQTIKEIGLEAFAEKEKERWRCLTCGGVICVHKGYCLRCGPASK